MHKFNETRPISEEAELTLEQLKPGEQGTICKYKRCQADESYLMEMGLVSGTHIKIIKYAPLGDPIELQVRGYHLSIRRSEAKRILVKRKNHTG